MQEEKEEQAWATSPGRKGGQVIATKEWGVTFDTPMDPPGVVHAPTTFLPLVEGLCFVY